MELAEKPKPTATLGDSGVQQDTLISDLLSTTSAAAEAVHGRSSSSPSSDTSSKRKMTFFAMANEMHNTSHSDSGNDPVDSVLTHFPLTSGYGTATLTQQKLAELMHSNAPLAPPRDGQKTGNLEHQETMHGLGSDILSDISAASTRGHSNSTDSFLKAEQMCSDELAHSEDQLSIPSPKFQYLQKPISTSDPTLYNKFKKKDPITTPVLGYKTVSVTTGKQVTKPTKVVMSVSKAPGSVSSDSEIVNVVSTQQVSSSEDTSDRSASEAPVSASDEDPIITVLASNGHKRSSETSSHRSSASSVCSQEKSGIRDRLSRFHPGTLQQGKLMTGGASSSDSLNAGELCVSQFTLGQKQKFMADNSLKRPSTNVARKKVVEAKLVIPTQPRKRVEPVYPRAAEEKPSAPAPLAPDMATTAALAAVSVVAASQPFIQVQQNLDQKVSELTAQISAMVSAAPRQADQQHNQATEDRIKFLENQVENLTHKRIEYLEYMQKQQFHLQDRLVRNNEKQQEDANLGQPKEAVRPTVIYKEVLPDDSRPLARISRSEPMLHTHNKSMLETPAPRRKPPSPTSYEEIKQHTPERPSKKDVAFLAQLLSTPEQRHSSDHSLLRNQHKEYPLKHRPSASPTVKRAKELERSMDNLSEHLKHTILSTPGDYDAPGFAPQEGPCPLDFYLATNVAPIPSSPYPDLATVRGKGVTSDVRGNAPIITKYLDAKSTLRQAQILQQYLEGNLESVLRSRQDVDLFSNQILDKGNVEDLRVKKMVDKQIQGMSREIEKDIMEKLLDVNEKYDRKTGQSRMVPERDTGLKPKFKARPAPVQSRVKPTTTASKQLKPTVSSPKFKRPTKVSTKYKNAIPPQILQKPFSAEKTARPAVVRQPSPHVLPVPRPLVKPSAPRVVASQGHMMPMAVPLRSPRKQTFPQPPAPALSPGPVMTSTPVSVHAQPADVLPTPQTKKRSLSPERTPLGVGHPSPVALVDTSTPGHKPAQEEQEETFSTDDGEQPLSSERIEIDGEAPVVEKPTVTLWQRQLAEKNQRQLSVVQDRACQWVAHEVLAQLTGQLYATQGFTRQPLLEEEGEESDMSEAPPIRRPKAAAPTVPRPQVIIDPGVSVTDDLVNALLKEALMERIQSMVVSRPGPDMEPLAPIVATEPGDQSETPSPGSSLMDGYLPPGPRDEYQISPPTTPELTPAHSPVPPLVSREEERPGAVYNPTPDVTPAASVADDMRDPPDYSSDFETDDEKPPLPPPLLETLNGVALDDSEDTFGGPRHDLSTPEATPPPSPPSQERQHQYVTPPRTPSPSLVPTSPEPSEAAPVQQEPIPELPVDVPQPRVPTPPPVEPPRKEESEEEESVHDTDDGKPEMRSVGIDAPESLSSPPPASPKPEPTSPATSVTQSVSSPVSDTVNDRLSEGQWIISQRSDGEIPMNVDSDFQELVFKSCLAGTRVQPRRRVSNDDTLMDTEELDPDHERSDVEVSEGEFLYRGKSAPLRDAELDEFRPPAGRVVTVAPVQDAPIHTDVSLGEVSLGQKLMSGRGRRGEQRGIRNVSRAFSSEQTTESSQQQVRFQEGDEDKARSPTVSDNNNITDDDSSPGAAAAAPPRMAERSPSPNRRHSPVSRGGSGGIMPTGNRGRPVSGMIMSTGLPRGDRGRVRPGLSSTHPHRSGRTASPEPKRSSLTFSGELHDVASSRDSFQTTRSDLDTMTPDQMNVELLLQSKDYLSATASDFGSTEFTQTSMNFTGEMTENTGASEGVAPTPSPRGRPLQVSVTIPSMGEEDESESVEDVSDYT